MKKMGFSENLKRIIEERSLKLTKISESTGIPMSTLSEWTAGREPKVSEALVKLCHFLNVSLDDLVLNEIGNEQIRRSSSATVLVLDGEKFRIQIERIK